jgi:hypothetical protein
MRALDERWRARGVELSRNGGAGRQDLELQTDTYRLADAAMTERSA